jgi:hypothetical protein
MVRRCVLALACVTTTWACVDLFHSTDFATLCDVSPDAATCMRAPQPADGAADVKDAAADGPDTRVCTTDKAVALRRAVRACELEVSCGGALATRQDCIAIAMQAYDCEFHPGAALATYWSCMRDARTCDAYNRCVFPGGVPTCSTAGPICAGTVAGDCAVAGAPARGISCAAEGKICSQPGGVPQCTGSQGIACGGGPRCDGTSAIACDGAQVDQGQDCAALGMRCVSTTASGAFCQSRTTTDCIATRTTCMDARAESCIDGKLTSIDCDRLGLTCSADLNVLQACRPPSGACAPSCVSGMLTACVRSDKSFVLPCTELGLGDCTEDAGARATCAPAR